MKILGFALAGALLLAACSSGSGSRGISSPAEVFVEGERSPQQTAGWCLPCNFSVHDGHRCGLTVPCALCTREVGANHVHEVVWHCESDDLIMAQRHVCNDAKTCATCRSDRRKLLSPRGCERCFRLVPPVKLQGITSYCQDCNLEVGANHVHGKSVFCQRCAREAGSNHLCDVTRFCFEHEQEHAPDHVHGSTTYCLKCHRDAGEGHQHGLTEWCWICHGEMEWPHCHHD